MQILKKEYQRYYSILRILNIESPSPSNLPKKNILFIYLPCPTSVSTTSSPSPNPKKILLSFFVIENKGPAKAPPTRDRRKSIGKNTRLVAI